MTKLASLQWLPLQAMKQTSWQQACMPLIVQPASVLIKFKGKIAH